MRVVGPVAVIAAIVLFIATMLLAFALTVAVPLIALVIGLGLLGTGHLWAALGVVRGASWRSCGRSIHVLAHASRELGHLTGEDAPALLEGVRRREATGCAGDIRKARRERHRQPSVRREPRTNRGP